VNKRLQLAVRNAVCTDCRFHVDAEHVCMTGSGPNDAQVMVVTKFPVSPESRLRMELEGYLSGVDIDPSQVMWCSAIKCNTYDLEPGTKDLKACRTYMTKEMEFVKPTHVLALGGEALFATTGKSGIMKYRGKLFTHGETVIFPTISPSMVVRNPGYRDGFLADMSYFSRLTKGQQSVIPYHMPTHTIDVRTKTALRALLTALTGAGVVAYDIESTGGSEHASDAAVVSIAFTVCTTDMSDAVVWRVPLFHPESPWRDKWITVLQHIYRYLCRVRRRVAHNAKFDTRWLRYWAHKGDTILTPTFDTIIAAALLDENRVKGLKPLAQQLLGADPWGIDTRDLLTTPLDEVLDYNGLDTWHDLRLYFHFREELKRQPRLMRLFVHLMMPAIQELVEVESRGVYVDRAVLATNTMTAEQHWKEIEHVLMGDVPSSPADVPDNLVNRRGEITVNFNPSNFLRWWLFDYLKLPVLARTKTGQPSTAEAIMMLLAEEFDVAKLMLERTRWVKMCTSFFYPYADQLDSDNRIHTTFKPWGTVTGRLSSGKEDVEKITSKAQTRGVNLQQVPRDKLVRGVFGAPPGSTFVEADYSQIELRIAAFLAREEHMLSLYRTGQDIHMAMAMRMTGRPASQITAEERKRAKAVNFGFLYGMGWAKFVLTAWTNYGLHVGEDEARAFRKAFFDEFPALPPWHARQRRLAAKYGYVSTPMGRVRHLPDIYSPDEAVRAEAERQAINSPVQGFASDMALLGMVHINREFRRRGLTGHPVGTVHDAVNFEIPNGELLEAIPIIRHTMENLPLDKLFGVELDVPIVVDMKAGRHWGGSSPIPYELTTMDSGRQLRQWLKENAA
jgi:uracil-DNA glycosylase family 4